MTFSTYIFGTRSSGRVPSAMEFLDMEKFTSILCLFVCLFKKDLKRARIHSS